MIEEILKAHYRVRIKTKKVPLKGLINLVYFLQPTKNKEKTEVTRQELIKVYGLSQGDIEVCDYSNILESTP